jgi:voltage-gated potassium channel
MHLVRRLVFIAVLVGALLAAGTAAFMLLEGWSFLDAFYMTVITIATVGFQEVHPLSPTGRIATILLIFGGAGTLAYGLTVVTAFVVEGELQKLLGQRRMEKTLGRLQDHVIVCGAGETGKHVVEELLRTGTPCVVVEQQPERLQAVDRVGAVVLVGDATRGEVLERARIREACGLITTLPSDKDNLFVILTAREANPRLRIVSRSIEDDSPSKLRRAGADTTVSANQIGGLRLASEMIRPHVVSFLDMMIRDRSRAVRIEEAVVVDGSPVIGASLADVDLHGRVGLVVIAVRHPSGEYTYNPKASTILQRGDVLILCADPAQLEALRAILHPGHQA